MHILMLIKLTGRIKITYIDIFELGQNDYSVIEHEF